MDFYHPGVCLVKLHRGHIYHAIAFNPNSLAEIVCFLVSSKGANLIGKCEVVANASAMMQLLIHIESSICQFKSRMFSAKWRHVQSWM